MADAIFFFGESHVDAVRAALVQAHRLPPHRTLNLAHVGKPLEPALFGDALVQDSLRPDAGAGCRYVSMVGGNAHNVLGLIRHPEEFDFVLPDQPALPVKAGARFLTYDYVCSALERLMRAAMNLLEAACSALQGPIVHLESPPPIGDNDYIVENLEAWFQNGGDYLIVAEPWLRFKLWRAHAHVMQKICTALGVRYIPVPEMARDGDGFLKKGYYANATHANAAYGSLLVDQLEGLFHEG